MDSAKFSHEIEPSMLFSFIPCQPPCMFHQVPTQALEYSVDFRRSPLPQVRHFLTEMAFPLDGHFHILLYLLA
jgi:hypothetical protein